MNRFIIRCRQSVTFVALLTLLEIFRPAVLAESPVRLQNWQGEIDLSAEGPLPFTLEGTASHLGRFTCHGEIEFVPGEEEGTLVGEGVAVFRAANGDLLVGVVTWEVDADQQITVGGSENRNALADQR